MAYYLGYKENEEFKPIDLNINNAHDILSLVNFTCDFETKNELIEYLSDEELIPDGDIELTYLIDKGKKGNKTYTSLPNISRIFYYGNSSAFDIDKLKLYIEKNIKDKSLVQYLLSNLLKKYGLGEHIRNFITDNITTQSRKVYLISILETIISNSNIILLNSGIQRLIEAIKRDDNLINLEIDSFIEFIQSNSDALVYLYRMFNRYLKFPKVLEIDDLLSLDYAIDSYHPNEIEIKNIIDRFISHYILKSEKINSRNLVDLGSMIQDYKDYLLELEMQRFTPMITREVEYDDRDEFLEEDDFARCDTTSQDAGIRLRPTDASSWGMNN